jgi:hypothetical protein
LKSWDPTEQEQTEWNLKIVEILKQVEEKQQRSKAVENQEDVKDQTLGTDRNGQKAIPYKESLAPFLKAAAEGNLIQLTELVERAKEKDAKESDEEQNLTQKRHRHLIGLLETTDRHKSTAEHWAAGNGHLQCLRFLDSVRAELNTTTVTDPETSKNKNQHHFRRRDGKTCLHYAARNGHINCIRYLIKDRPKENLRHAVDERSGEGTTPLHLACYGGQYDAAKYLIEDCRANVHAKNDWGCSVAHWVAMTISKSGSDIRKLCTYLLHHHDVSFVETQGQGHTVLHKAAHRGNRHVIRWMAETKDKGGAGLTASQKDLAGVPDLGGHKPSDIWQSIFGDDDFALWMKTEMGW